MLLGANAFPSIEAYFAYFARKDLENAFPSMWYEGWTDVSLACGFQHGFNAMQVAKDSIIGFFSSFVCDIRALRTKTFFTAQGMCVHVVHTESKLVVEDLISRQKWSVDFEAKTTYWLITYKREPLSAN